ncbi:hypothetical protein F5Y18DRAFT_207927 [Xylariaceae sp. FL1019]|nr:hypothetical protein F5Y18DRAFT_207927 [Xylariaceae sp. FL1019]
MATTMTDVGARPKKKLNTYGKSGTRKRQPKAVFTPQTTSESMSEEDPITSPNPTATATRPKPPAVAEPNAVSPIARIKRPDTNRNVRVTSKPSSVRTTSLPDRKRKLPQKQAPKQVAKQAVASEWDFDDAQSAPAPIRLPKTTTDDGPPNLQNKRRVRVQSTPPNPSNVNTANPRLSSPPPTPPAQRKPPKSSTQLAHSVARAKSTSASLQATTRPTVLHQHHIPLHLARDSIQKSKQTSVPLSTVTDEPQQSTSKRKAASSILQSRPKKRLIDALVEQIQDDDEEEEEEDEDDEDELDEIFENLLKPTQSSLSQMSTDTDLPSLPSTPNRRARGVPTTGARTFQRSSSALKFTYGQSRKVLEEDNLLESLALPESSSYSLKGRRLELGVPKKPVSTVGMFDDDDPTDSPGSKLRDIHELRQAGANSRAADTMQDLIDRMGKAGATSSSRRSALLEVAEKLKEKNYVRQCRDHGAESAMLRGVGKETDVICGYLILASLATIMAKEPSAHIGRVLQEEQAGPLFARLLGVREDIKKIVKDRKSNVSPRNRNSIISVEGSLQELSLWEEGRPSYISPRYLAVKCLQLLVAQGAITGEDTTIFSEDVTERLFDVLSDASTSHDYWEHPAATQAMELHSTLSVLEVHVIASALVDGERQRANRYLPIVADALHAWLHTPSHCSQTLDMSMLKLVLNLTNDNEGATEIFARKGIIAALAASACAAFDQAVASIPQGFWTEESMDAIILRLGILINFAESSPLMRQIMTNGQHKNEQALNNFIRIFLDHHRRTGEADSIEKTHTNVVVGYLSVLLGYLALHKPTRLRIKATHPSRSIGPLTESIREFNSHHERVEEAMNENAGIAAHGQNSQYTERLRALILQLQVEAAND